MRNHALRTSVLLGAFLLPVLSFAQGLSGPGQCEGGVGDAIAYLHQYPGPNQCVGAANNSPQVQQFFNRLATVPSPTQQANYATLINGLVAAGVWAHLDVLCVVGIDNATTLTNLVQSTYTATLVGAPSFASFTGYSIGSSINYVDTGFNPTSPGLNYQENGAFLAAWNLASDAQPVALLRTVANVNIEIWPAYGNGSACFMVNNAGSVEDLVASSSSSGWFYAQRTGANALALYQNDTQLGSATTGPTTPENNDIVIDEPRSRLPRSGRSHELTC